MVEAKGLSVGYGNNVILQGVDFSLPCGCMAVLLGSNGSGKSTLLSVLCGNAKPQKGTVSISGKNVHVCSGRELAKMVSIVVPDTRGAGALTVKEIVALGRYPYTGIFGRLTNQDEEFISKAIETVGIGDLKYRYFGTLSDGERQKVMLARAVAQDTDVIFLDEPTAFLDVGGKIETVKLLRKFADRGKTIILSTHDLHSALSAADTLMVANKQKRILTCGSKEALISEGVLDAAFPNLTFLPDSLTFI